jgi:hypothetical protein
MRVVSTKRFPAPADELRRRLFEGFSAPEPTSAAPPGPGSQALNVLVDGFLHGSLLTLAVCTPKRRSLFSSQTIAGHSGRQEKPFRTYIVSPLENQPSSTGSSGAEPASEQQPGVTAPLPH